MRLILFLVMLLIPTTASGQTLVIDGDNYYYMVRGADGDLELRKFAQVIRYDGTNPIPDPGDPTDPNPPGPGPLEEVTRQVAAWTAEVGDATTARALSAVYSLVAEEVAGGDLSPSTAFEGIRRGTNLVLRQQDAEAAWDDWRGQVSDLLARMQQDGDLDSAEEVAATFEAVAEGLKRASPGEGNAIGDRINWERLFELLKLILELLRTFSAEAG